MVSGGTPGTYSRLDSGGGAEGAELRGVARSPGMTSKADRRAGIHISGPFSVTVPLHITSGLALGVLHGGWNDKEQPLQGDEAEDEDVKSTETETESTDGNTQSKNDDVQEKEEEANCSVKSQVDCGKEMAEITKKENDMPEKGDPLNAKEAEHLSQNQESVQENVEDTQPQNKEKTPEEDYMDMRGNLHQEPVSPHFYEDMEFPDSDLPMDFQEAFGFLDSMDSCAANPVEFSVEAPCFENEYEEEEDENKDNQAVSGPSQNGTNDRQTPAAKSSSPSFTHRPLPGKSHSLPYKSRPFLPALSLSSDDEYSPADDDDDEDESDKEYEDMFCQSLPAGQGYQGLSWLSSSNNVDLHTSNQSNALPPENNNDAQSIGQSEDTIPAASASADSSEEHLGSGALKTDDVCMDEKMKEERDVENEKHTLIGEDDPESEASEEDTYFGPDSIPSSPEPDQTEPIPAPSPAEDAHQVLDADGCHGNSEVPITAELTDAERTQIINETETEDKKKDEKSEETMKAVRNMKENEGEECENNNKTDTGEEKCEDVVEDAEAGSVEECRDGNEEQKQVNTTERKEDLDENSGDGPKEEAKRHDLEKNSGECEEGDEEHAKEEEEEVKRQEDLEEIRGESENVDEEHRKEEKKDENEAERHKDLAENHGECEGNANDGPKEGEQDRNDDERQEDLEENAKEEAKVQDGECEETDEEHAKEEEQEDKRQEDLEESNGESENVDEEHTTEEEHEAERTEDFEENCGYCEENAKDEVKEQETNSGECEEEHAKEIRKLKEDSGDCEKVDEEHTTEEEDKNQSESSEGNSEEDVKVKPETLSPEGGDDPETSTSVQRPDASKETEEGEIKRSPRRAANPSKAVPVVPPKPQNSKLTALRKQLQHRQPDDKGAQPDPEQAAETTEDSPENGPGERRGTWDGERRRDADRDAKRNSGISMCFDEAVARATEKRSRERESTERLSGAQWDRDRRDGKTD